MRGTIIHLLIFIRRFLFGSLNFGLVICFMITRFFLLLFHIIVY